GGPGRTRLGQPEAARADRVDDRRHALPGQRQPRAERPLPEDPRRAETGSHSRSRHPLRRALPALRAGRVRAARSRDRAAPHPLLEDSLNVRFVSPHALWLLLAVPVAVIGYRILFGARLRTLARHYVA